MFTRAIVRPPGSNFADGLTTVNLGVPDYQKALEQHEQYCAALTQAGLTLTRLAADTRFPDATFMEDVAVATPRGAILTHPGAPTRAGEVETIRATLSQYYGPLSMIDAPGTLEGGDVCNAGDGHFLIGISRRTNEEGARQLSAWLARLGYTSQCVDFRDRRSILHLTTGMTALGHHRLAVVPELADHPALRDYELVRTVPGEAYAANCLRVNDVVLVAAGFPTFEAYLQRLGYHTVAVEMSEFQKMDGGLTCLSLRF
ncbi:MAG: arginine deiminase family protein [Chloroflexi bacterium]|nr:arginine deiminase family protein [Chloroflexota bacterium]MCL5275249.1 arginine deiminase family protein [Chloroflexota bacterium]